MTAPLYKPGARFENMGRPCFQGETAKGQMKERQRIGGLLNEERSNYEVNLDMEKDKLVSLKKRPKTKIDVIRLDTNKQTKMCTWHMVFPGEERAHELSTALAMKEDWGEISLVMEGYRGERPWAGRGEIPPESDPSLPEDVSFLFFQILSTSFPSPARGVSLFSSGTKNSGECFSKNREEANVAIYAARSQPQTLRSDPVIALAFPSFISFSTIEGGGVGFEFGGFSPWRMMKTRWRCSTIAFQSVM